MKRKTSPKSKIFLSYRRDDSAGYAGRLHDRLSMHFGEEQIFIDIDTIEPGDDFENIIKEAVTSCKIFIAIIGKNWLINPSNNKRRLDDTNDFVRIEIATALQEDLLVIPVLIQGATMPLPQELPKDIESLSKRQALEISDTRWRYDVGQLIDKLEQELSRTLARDEIPLQQEKQVKGKLSTIHILKLKARENLFKIIIAAIAAFLILLLAPYIKQFLTSSKQLQQPKITSKPSKIPIGIIEPPPDWLEPYLRELDGYAQEIKKRGEIKDYIVCTISSPSMTEASGFTWKLSMNDNYNLSGKAFRVTKSGVIQPLEVVKLGYGQLSCKVPDLDDGDKLFIVYILTTKGYEIWGCNTNFYSLIE